MRMKKKKRIVALKTQNEKDVKSISELKRRFGTISAMEPELKKHDGIIRSWIAVFYLTNNKTNGFKWNT